jgi:hypothetical protein
LCSRRRAQSAVPPAVPPATLCAGCVTVRTRAQGPGERRQAKCRRNVLTSFQGKARKRTARCPAGRGTCSRRARGESSSGLRRSRWERTGRRSYPAWALWPQNDPLRNTERRRETGAPRARRQWAAQPHCDLPNHARDPCLCPPLQRGVRGCSPFNKTNEISSAL